MNYNSKMGYSGNEQDYQLVKASLSKLKNQIRYLTNVLPNPTEIVSLDNAQNTVKSVKAQLGNSTTVTDFSTVKVKTYGKNLFDISSSRGFESESDVIKNTKSGNTITVYSTTGTTVNACLLLGTLPKGTYTISLNTSKRKDIFIQYGESVSNLTRFDDSVFNYNTDFKASYTFSISETRKIWLTAHMGGGESMSFSAIQLESGTTKTDYEPYKGAEYTPAADGTVNGIAVLTPTTNITNDKGLLFTTVIGDDFNYIN